MILFYHEFYPLNRMLYIYLAYIGSVLENGFWTCPTPLLSILYMIIIDYSFLMFIGLG